MMRQSVLQGLLLLHVELNLVQITFNRCSAEIITFETIQYIKRLTKSKDNWLQHQEIGISFFCFANLDTTGLHTKKGHQEC